MGSSKNYFRSDMLQLRNTTPFANPLLEIPVEELSTVLRSLGYNCTAATLQQMIIDADPEETGKVRSLPSLRHEIMVAVQISENTFLRQVSRAEHESIQSSATAAQLEGLRVGSDLYCRRVFVG